MGGASVLLRFALYLDLMVLFGLPLVGLYAIGAGQLWAVTALTIRRRFAVTAGVGILLSSAAMLSLLADMAGQPVGALEPTMVRVVIVETAIGHAFLARTMGLILTCLIALPSALKPTYRLYGAAFLTGVSLASLAWTGHGAMDEGVLGWAHLIADIIHLLAAGVWICALVCLLWLCLKDLSDPVSRLQTEWALRAFSGIGMAVVLTLLATGVINSWILLGKPGEHLFPLNAYRALLLAKVIAFTGMLMLASLNRWWLVPRLARGGTGIRISLIVETALGLIILLLVATLGRLAPFGD